MVFIEFITVEDKMKKDMTIMHFYLYTCLKKTYKGATYHNRKSSICHNGLVALQ